MSLIWTHMEIYVYYIYSICVHFICSRMEIYVYNHVYNFEIRCP